MQPYRLDSSRFSHEVLADFRRPSSEMVLLDGLLTRPMSCSSYESPPSYKRAIFDALQRIHVKGPDVMDLGHSARLKDAPSL